MSINNTFIKYDGAQNPFKKTGRYRKAIRVGKPKIKHT